MLKKFLSAFFLINVVIVCKFELAYLESLSFLSPSKEYVYKSNKKNNTQSSTTPVMGNNLVDGGGSSSSSLNRNPLFDVLTALLYHVEHTKTCGNNLQKQNIDLQPLWNSKFSSQLKMSIQFTNSVNNLIANDVNEDNNFENFNSKKFDLNVLPSLSHFMFKSLSDTSKAGSTAFNNTKELFDRDENGNLEDPYLLGYGVVLFNEDVVDTTPSKPTASNFKCLYVKQNPLFNKNDEKKASKKGSEIIYLKENSCDSMNLYPSVIKEPKNLHGNNGNNEDPYNDCLSWMTNLKSTYAKFLSAYENDSLIEMSYQQFLDKLLGDKNLSSSLWCGPFYECKNTTANNWILLYSLPLFDGKKNLKGAVLIKFKINNLDINQCNQGDPIFYNTHKCLENSECVYSGQPSFKAGNYYCRCNKGFIGTNNGNVTRSYYNGAILESQYWLMKNRKTNVYNSLNCLPCSGLECCRVEASIIENSVLSLNFDDLVAKDYSIQANIFWNCRKYNMTLRYSIFVVQIIFILITISLAMVIFYFRHNKLTNIRKKEGLPYYYRNLIIKQSMWILLEMVLFGTVLLYATLILQHFEPTTDKCLAIPWFRELGFTIVYGILNLRLYKILVEFQSRKAHCMQLKEKDILRILFCITICVLGYLTAWTLVDLDYASEGFSLVTNTSLKSLIQYPVCKIKWWDYFIEIVEFLFICAGFYLLYCTRTAPSEFNERKFISIVIYSEGIISTFLHIIKHSIFSSIHPDTILILYFIRCHATVTVMLFFIFVTKLYILFKPNTADYCRNTRMSTADAHEHGQSFETIKFQKGQRINTSDLENGDININEMEPEEIRGELKRLYTQLHVYKTKSLKKDNPHLQSKRRVAKKNRRFSHAITKNTKENESYHIKTPDESICSNEANLPHSIVGSEEREPNNSVKISL